MQIPNQLGANPEDMTITKDEFKKIEKAMKRPEFGELMSDYMKEISDPKNREEYDQYLQQLERDSELPKGMKLIKPDPHFCIKTMIWSKANKKQQQKFFVNVCSSAVIDQPASETVEQAGQKGQSWKLPYSVGKIRYDQDKKGSVCNTVDVAFHPYSIGFCNKIPGFQNMLCQTALDASQKQLGERQEDISKDFKILKGTKCKGNEPALLPVRMDKKGKLSNELDTRQGGQQNAQTKLQKEINEMRSETQDKKEETLQEEEEIFKESNEIESGAVSQPKYRFIYSYPVEYGDFLDQNLQGKKLPNQLGCDIRLPKAANLKEIELDLSENQLILDVPRKYYLDIKLPYPVESNNGTAKFDQKSKQLKIRVPIQKEYLKQKYQEELKEIQNRKENIKDDIEEEIQDDYQVNFIPQTTDHLIEEVDEQKQVTQSVDRIEYNELTFNQRIEENKMFLIIKAKDYTLQNLTIKVSETELCIFYQLEYPQLKTLNFLHCQFNRQQLRPKIDLVTDYIVIKYEFEENTEMITIDYTQIPFTEFLEKLESIKEIQEPEKEIEIPEKKIDFQETMNDEDDDSTQQIIQVDQQTQPLQEQSSSQQILQQQQQQQQQYDQEDNHKTKSDLQDNGIQNENSEASNYNIHIKKNIQFIAFNDIMTNVFDID